MKFRTHNDGDIELQGTSLEGYIQATRAQLEKVFGQPLLDDGGTGSDGKVPLWWEVQFENGAVARIYVYCRPAPQMNDLVSWHVGTARAADVGLVHEAFRDALGLGVPQRKAA